MTERPSTSGTLVSRCVPRLLVLMLCLTAGRAGAQRIFFTEHCDSADFRARGWYDNDRLVVTDAEHIHGSAGSLEFRFLKGGTTPVSGGSMRRLFPETDSVYLSYWVKYSADWTGSDRPYHPHEFHFITNADDRYIGPAATHLTAYIEQNEGRPLLAIQDALNIDAARINQDLALVTEQRAVAGCNGTSDRYPAGDCYRAGDGYRNGKAWKAERGCFTDTPGRYYKNEWHFVEAFFKLNGIAGGKGIADGIARYWFDGELMIDAPGVMLRTAEHPGMGFNQFLIAPYIGDGSPVEQTMWVDEITVADSRPVSAAGADPDARDMPQLGRNYPNPFAQATITPCRMPVAGRVRLELRDQLGRIVATLVDEFRIEGAHSAAFDPAAAGLPLPPGVYFYRLLTPPGCVTRLMMRRP